MKTQLFLAGYMSKSANDPINTKPVIPDKTKSMGAKQPLDVQAKALSKQVNQLKLSNANSRGNDPTPALNSTKLLENAQSNVLTPT